MKREKAVEPEPIEAVEATEAAETETLPSLEDALSLPESVSLNQINAALRLRAKGASIRDIATKLGLSEPTTGRLLKGINQVTSQRLVSSIPLEATKSLTNLEVGEFVPETFQSDLYQILRNAMRFNVWFNSLPDELKNLVVKPSQQQGGQKPNPSSNTSEASIISDGDVRRIVLLNFALKPQSPQGANVTPQSTEAEVKRIMDIFKTLRELESSAVTQRKQIEQEVRESIEPKKSSIEKVGEALHTIRKEAEPLIKTVVESVQQAKSGPPPPPPPQTPPPIEAAPSEEQIEAQQLGKIEGTPPKVENLLHEQGEGTFAESEGLPPEPETESPTEPPASGGSASEVEKRLKEGRR